MGPQDSPWRGRSDFPHEPQPDPVLLQAPWLQVRRLRRRWQDSKRADHGRFPATALAWQRHWNQVLPDRGISPSSRPGRSKQVPSVWDRYPMAVREHSPSSGQDSANQGSTDHGHLKVLRVDLVHLASSGRRVPRLAWHRALQVSHHGLRENRVLPVQRPSSAYDQPPARWKWAPPRELQAVPEVSTSRNQSSVRSQGRLFRTKPSSSVFGSRSPCTDSFANLLVRKVPTLTHFSKMGMRYDRRCEWRDARGPLNDAVPATLSQGVLASEAPPGERNSVASPLNPTRLRRWNLISFGSQKPRPRRSKTRSESARLVRNPTTYG